VLRRMLGLNVEQHRSEYSNIHKEDLILIHRTLFLIKELFEKAGISNGHFEFYEQINTLPTHIHKTKREHKRAIFILVEGIMEFFESKPGTDVVVELLQRGQRGL